MNDAQAHHDANILRMAQNAANPSPMGTIPNNAEESVRVAKVNTDGSITPYGRFGVDSFGSFYFAKKG